MLFSSNKEIKIKQFDKTKHIIYFNYSGKIQAKKKGLKKAIFLDRDGVIIEDVNYIKDPKSVFILKGVDDLLNHSKNLGYLNIIITNQSGISRKFFNWEDYEKVTNKMIELINYKKTINAIYANGEGPNNQIDIDSWRKPNPNMLIQASKDFHIDLSSSILIGDRLSDIQAGERAGIKNLFHVLTGHGVNERKKIINYYDNYNKSYNLNLIDNLSSFQNKFL